MDAENVEMKIFAAHKLRNIDRHLCKFSCTLVPSSELDQIRRMAREPAGPSKHVCVPHHVCAGRLHVCVAHAGAASPSMSVH
eukprot:scaffold116281_cov22-Tisochrysis_lutea.AAC.1